MERMIVSMSNSLPGSYVSWFAMYIDINARLSSAQLNSFDNDTIVCIDTEIPEQRERPHISQLPAHSIEHIKAAAFDELLSVGESDKSDEQILQRIHTLQKLRIGIEKYRGTHDPFVR